MGFARAWGFGGVALANLFALRSTDPMALIGDADPIGPENDYWIDRLAASGGAVVAAWGFRGDLYGRAEKVLTRLPRPLALGTTASGFPRHPLYVRGDRTPIPYIWNPAA